MRDPGVYVGSTDVSQCEGDPSHGICDDRMCIVYDAEQAKLCDEMVRLASVAVKSCRWDTYQASVHKRVFAWPRLELSRLEGFRFPVVL